MFKKTLSIYWAAIRPRKGLFFISFIASTLFFTCNYILLPLLISKFVGMLTNINGKELADFTNLILMWLVLAAAELTLGRINLYTWFRVMSYSLMDLDMMSFRVTMKQSSDFFANNFTGSLVTRFNRLSRSFNLIGNALIFDLNALFVQIVFASIVLFFVSPIIAVVFLVWSLFFAYSMIYLHRRKYPKARAVAEYDSHATGFVADSFTNVLSVKMFSSFNAEYKSFERLNLKRAKVRLVNMLANDHIRVFKFINVLIMEIVVIILSAKLAIEGTISIAEVILVQLYLRQLISGLWEFGKLVEKLEEAFADADEMVEIYELVPSVMDVQKPIKFDDQKISGDISVQNVDFRYDGDNEKDVFKDININIPKGQKVGLVGPSGGGKTTLTKLLLRFMDINSGTITIDGLDISQMTQDDLRSLISYVPQEPLLFHRSIYDNIAYSNPSASKEEVLEVSRLAHAEEFILGLPNGYDTLVGERGVKLSGGQKQRIAIARAMLKKSPILLLDEATSALDSKSERYITDALNSLMQGRTTIVIAHRLSTIRKLDRIILLKDGKVVEDGTHRQLLSEKGVYADLWTHQHGGFIDE